MLKLKSCILAFGLCALTAGGIAAVPGARPAPRRILYVVENGPAGPGRACSKRAGEPGCWGFHHASTEHSEEVLKLLGQQSGAFTVDVTTDATGTLAKQNLKRYAAVAFFASGEPKMSGQQKTDFLAWVRAGHGVACFHAGCTDQWFTWPAFHAMIGATFDNHPWHAGTTLWVRDEDPKFPSQTQWPAEFQWTDEFYEFPNLVRADVHPLLSLDPNKLDMSVPGIHRKDKDFINAWVKSYGKGRIFVTALGHADATWDNPDFRKQVEMGVRWADGEIPYPIHTP
jgi:hypothetical protein